MSVYGEVLRRLVRPLPASLLAAAEPLTGTAPGAFALEVGVRYEACARRAGRWSASSIEILTGLRTEDRRRTEAEHRARARLAPGRPVSGPGVPEVFWHGPDRAGDRPVVLLLNGWAASGLLWPAALLARLEAHADVVRIDNRGSGYSRTAPAPFTLARLADDAADVLRALDAPPAVVVGLSMGGMIAQELAVRHPTLVRHLVLCGTRPPSPAAFPAAPAVLARTFEGPAPGESRRDHLARTWGSVLGPGFADRSPEVVAELVDLVAERPTPYAGVVSQMRAIACWYGAGRTAGIAVPTDVVHGSDDPLIPVGNGMRLAQAIAGARYRELRGVGHIVPFEAPDVVAEIVSGVLGSGRGRRRVAIRP